MGKVIPWFAVVLCSTKVLVYKSCGELLSIRSNSHLGRLKPDCSLTYFGFFHMYDLGVSYTFHFREKKMRNHP